MHTEKIFQHLAPHSKVWIYQSDKHIDDAQVALIKDEVKQFVSVWTSHSQKVIAGADVLFNYFIVLAADEQQVQVGGCSIDSSVQFMQRLAEKYNLNFFDRFFTVYVLNDKIHGADKNTFQQLIENGTLNEATPVFNNLVQNVAELQTKWLVPLHQSWHKRVFSFPLTIADKE
jgi:hypothetical protein